MKKILIIVIFVFSIHLIYAGIYNIRINTWSKIEHIKKILLPDLINPARIDAIKLAERGDAYYRLKDYKEALKYYIMASKRVDDIKELMNFYDDYQDIKRLYLKVKNEKNYLFEHNFISHFPKEEFLDYFDEAERSYNKLQIAMKSLDYKVARRRTRIGRIKDNLLRVEKGVKLYSEKNYWFDLSEYMYIRVKNALNYLNETRDIARNPIDIHSLRIRNEKLKQEYDNLLSKARDSIFYVNIESLKLLYADFAKIADDLGDITYNIDESIVTMDEKAKLAKMIWNDPYFKVFFPRDFKDFSTNYNHFINIKKSANTPSEIRECEIYLDRALKNKKEYLEYSDFVRRDNILRRWYFDTQKRDNFTLSNKKSFYLLSVKNYVSEADNARLTGKYKDFKDSIKKAEEYRGKYEEN